MAEDKNVVKNQDKTLYEKIIDRYEWVKGVLNQKGIPSDKILTEENMGLISALVSDAQTMYVLSDDEIEEALLQSVTEKNTLNEDKFKKACNDLYEHKNGVPLTKEQALINSLERISPKQLLEDLSSGKTVSKQDLRVVNEVMEESGLPEPVINILIHYVLLNSNMKLNKPYLSKIASHWSRINIKTAKEALSVAKREKEHLRKRKQAPAPKPAVEHSFIKEEPFNDEKPFTVFEYRYMEKLFDKYKMDLDIGREIILYGRKINHGLMIYWFLDAVSDYVHRNNAKTVSGTKDLLNTFHNKYVKNFGKE